MRGDIAPLEPRKGLLFIMQRFWNKVHKLPGDDACWIWQASLNSGGYGQFRFDGKVRRAHQVSWKLEKGQWAPYLCHTCDTPACVNPAHLYEGDNQGNMDDKYKRGRSNHRTKYSNHLVRRIRRMYAVGFSSTYIIEQLQLPNSTVHNILNGNTRRSAGGPIRQPGQRYYGNRFKKTDSQNRRSVNRPLTMSQKS